MKLAPTSKFGWILAVAFLIKMAPLSAQILPPDFVCIKNDTLIWNPASNSCGPFQSYDIYFSGNPQGPFNLLARITDPATTFFFHANPTNITWYYYLESVHNCPGQTSLHSDTLNNLSPAIAIINSVSVEGNNVRIKWERSPSAQVNAYIIYRTTALGTVPIDTAFNNLEYLDQGANPSGKSENYYIVALDRCGNSSLFGDPHNTIFLQSEFNTCQQTITLRWNIYKNWQNPIETQEVWLSRNGDPPQMVGTVDGNQDNFVFQNANDGENYCFYINAIEQNTGNFAASNVVCLSPDFVQPMRNIRIKNVSVTADDDIEITWVWDANAELNEAGLFSNFEGNDVIETTPLTISPLFFENTFLFENAEPDKKEWNFSIGTIDQCGTTFNSLNAAPVFLTVNPATQGQINDLIWTAPELPFSEIIEYQIFKSAGNQTIFLNTVDAGTLTYSDALSADDLNVEKVCYYILARTIFTYPDGTKAEVFSRSNTACATQDVQIFLPNAFAPRGRNQIFKPVFSFGQTKSYEFKIFNRWGGLIFQTNDPETGWNGKQDGKDVPQAVYTYALKIIQPSGEIIQKSGWVMLLR